MANQERTTRKISVRKNPRHPQFKGIWIPAVMYSIFELGSLDRELLSFITNFGKRGCRASNAYISDLLRVDVATTKRCVAKLKCLKLIVNIGPNPFNRILRCNPRMIAGFSKDNNQAQNAPTALTNQAQNAPEPGAKCAQTRRKMQPLIRAC